MTISLLQVGNQVIVEHEHFQQLLVVLRSRGYEVVGPTVRDNAIVYSALTSVADLPVGYIVEDRSQKVRRNHGTLRFHS